MLNYVSVLCLMLSLSAFSSTFVPVSMKKQIRESDAFVYGKVINISSIPDANSVVTKVFIRADKWMGLELPNNHLEVYYPGGKLDDIAVKVEGTPSFKEGEKVLVFLGKDQEGRYWGRNLGVGKYSEKTYGNGKIFINEIFPNHPKMGQIPSNYFFNLARKVKAKDFIERSKDKYEIQEIRNRSRLNIEKKYGRSVASVKNQNENDSHNKISSFWLLVILAVMGAFSVLKNKRKS